MLVVQNIFIYVAALVFSIDSDRSLFKKSIRTMESLLAHDIKHRGNMDKLTNMGIDSGYSPDMLEHLLPMYYKKVFPYNLFVRWLSYHRAPKSYFSYREFCFTLKDDIYVRFQSFADQAEFEKELQRIQPHKMDIGAVYTHRPREHKSIKSSAFQAVERELIFDIDMTDYDEVRYCCSEANICHRCWTLMKVAVRVIDRALREDFGFRHMLWVYSGRRGVHCWVGDETARKLSSSARTAVAEYLTLVRGGDDKMRKVNLSREQVLKHPFVDASLAIVREYFPRYACEQQNFMGNPKRVLKVLRMFPEKLEKVQDTLEGLWVMKDEGKEDEELSTRRWNTLKKHLSGEGLVGKSTEAEIMMQFVYPRLDINVTNGINHLLKSPFCIHPKTGRVCVPFDARQVDSFDPAEVPTISQILEEMGSRSSEGPRLLPYKNTSMKEPIRIFEKFVTGLEEEAKTLQGEGDKTLDF